MQKLEIKVIWDLSWDQVVIMTVRRAAHRPGHRPGRWQVVMWGVKKRGIIEGASGLARDPEAMFELESHAVEAASWQGGAKPAHPLAAKAAKAAKAWQELAALAGKWGEPGYSKFMRERWAAVWELKAEAGRRIAAREKAEAEAEAARRKERQEGGGWNPVCGSFAQFLNPRDATEARNDETKTHPGRYVTRRD